MGVFTSQGYKVVKKRGRFEVRENETQQFLGSYEYIKQANDQVRQFNLGKGFNGWTPPFMLDKVPITSFRSIDEES